VGSVEEKQTRGIRPDYPVAASQNPRFHMEILLKKAALESEFRRLVMKDPLAAAASIELPLTESEQRVLRDITVEQLESTIAHSVIAPGEEEALHLPRGSEILAAWEEIGREQQKAVPLTPPSPAGMRPGWDRPKPSQERVQTRGPLLIVMGLPLLILVLLIYLALRWAGVL